MNTYEKNLLSHIEKYGCSVTSVFDPEGDEPPFTYSIGIAKSAAAPELIIVGLKSELSHWLVNEYNRRVRGGETFVPGATYRGFLEGHEVQFVEVAEEHREGYMLSACWLHGGPSFEALQMVWPSTSGAWPWDPELPDSLRQSQPLLSKTSAAI